MRHLLRLPVFQLSSGTQQSWLCLGISRWKGSNHSKQDAAVAPIRSFLAMFNLHNLQGLAVHITYSWCLHIQQGKRTTHLRKKMPLHYCSNMFFKSLWRPDCLVCILPSEFSVTKPSTAMPVSLLTRFILYVCTPAPSLLEPLWKQLEHLPLKTNMLIMV